MKSEIFRPLIYKIYIFNGVYNLYRLENLYYHDKILLKHMGLGQYYDAQSFLPVFCRNTCLYDRNVFCSN